MTTCLPLGHWRPAGRALAAVLPITQPSVPATQSVDRLSDHAAPTALPGLPHAAPESPKLSRTDRVLDALTHWAGSKYAFGTTLALLTGWAIAGIPLKGSDTWQIVMEDASSIQCYFSDSLLMRQQHNQARDLDAMARAWRSSNATKLRLLQELLAHPERLRGAQPISIHLPGVDLEAGVRLTPHGGLDRTADAALRFTGSPWAMGIYVGGIIGWLAGVGPVQHFGDTWQLYVNTAVAVELTFVSMFLQNRRRRHMEYLEECQRDINQLDTAIERFLRTHAGDAMANPAIVPTLVPRGRGTRAIDVYSHAVASGVGMGVTGAVFGTWIGLGHTLGWSSNWWLIIGTYAGLVGFFDGFILRNVQKRQSAALRAEYDRLITSDSGVLVGARLPIMAPTVGPEPGRIERASATMCDALGRPEAVVGSIVFIGALLGIATGLHWSVTGQLICNTPTMIIEGFLMLVLIQAHNRVHAETRQVFYDALARRIALATGLNQSV